MESLRKLWRRRSRPVPTGLNLTVYTRQGCGCCDKAFALLHDRQRRYLFTIAEVDIDTDPDLVALHDTSVPVVAIDGKVRFRGVVDPVLLDRLLTASAGELTDGLVAAGGLRPGRLRQTARTGSGQDAARGRVRAGAPGGDRRGAAVRHARHLERSGPPRTRRPARARLRPRRRRPVVRRAVPPRSPSNRRPKATSASGCAPSSRAIRRRGQPGRPDRLGRARASTRRTSSARSCAWKAATSSSAPRPTAAITSSAVEGPPAALRRHRLEHFGSPRPDHRPAPRHRLGLAILALVRHRHPRRLAGPRRPPPPLRRAGIAPRLPRTEALARADQWV